MILAIYIINYPPIIPGNVIQVDHLLKNKEKYEGEKITISITKMKELGENSFTLVSWNGNYRTKVSFDDETKIEGMLNNGKVITLEGKVLNLEGEIKAEKIHVHENYFWRAFVSPLALLYVIYRLHKEKVLWYA